MVSELIKRITDFGDFWVRFIKYLSDVQMCVKLLADVRRNTGIVVVRRLTLVKKILEHLTDHRYLQWFFFYFKQTAEYGVCLKWEDGIVFRPCLVGFIVLQAIASFRELEVRNELG